MPDTHTVDIHISLISDKRHATNGRRFLRSTEVRYTQSTKKWRGGTSFGWHRKKQRRYISLVFGFCTVGGKGQSGHINPALSLTLPDPCLYPGPHDHTPHTPRADYAPGASRRLPPPRRVLTLSARVSSRPPSQLRPASHPTGSFFASSSSREAPSAGRRRACGSCLVRVWQGVCRWRRRASSGSWPV